MDYFSLTGRCGALVLIAAMLTGCGDREPVFSDLALSIGGLDFPHTREQLALCEETNDEACLRAYRRVKAAKESLFSRPRKQALQLVFDAIRKDCGKPEADLSTELTCTGAIVALYFFSTPQDDLSIRAFLDGLPASVLRKTLSTGGGWLTNRENKPAWREWVSKSRFSGEDRQAFLIFLDLRPNPDSTINHLDDPN